jgi:hypothetical protein
MKFQRGDRVLVRVDATKVYGNTVRVSYRDSWPAKFVVEPATVLRTFGSEPDLSVAFDREIVEPDDCDANGLPSFGAVVRGDDVLPFPTDR